MTAPTIREYAESVGWKERRRAQPGRRMTDVDSESFWALSALVAACKTNRAELPERVLHQLVAYETCVNDALERRAATVRATV